jgi:phosphoglycerate dehydrogenase-like enzyme
MSSGLRLRFPVGSSRWPEQQDGQAPLKRDDDCFLPQAYYNVRTFTTDFRAAEDRVTMRLTFLDDDHVMEVIRSLVSWREADASYVDRFFRPERVDLAELEEIGAGLRSAGATCARAKTLAPDAVRESAVILFRRGQVTAEMMNQCPDLRLIQRLGESAGRIDLAAAQARGVAVSCLPRRTLIHVAEHVLMLMLALSRKLLPSDTAARRSAPGTTAQVGDVAYNWPGLSGIGLLAGKTLGIVGLGEIGILVARRAAAFGMKIIYTNREPVGVDCEQELAASFMPLRELLRAADFVSLHVPGTPSNRHLIGANELASMRKDALLINTARGMLVDETALFDALANGRLAGAGLDVHAIEPRPAGSQLATLPNIVFTPHIAGGSRTGVLDEARLVIENLEAAVSGRPVRHGVVVAGPGV